MREIYDKSPDCQYSKSIICQTENRHCDKCAWNPAVNKNRLEKVRTEHTHVTSGY